MSTLEEVCWQSIEDNNFRKARLFLQNGAKADTILASGVSIVHLLSVRGDCNELLELCLQYGASPNVPNSEGITPVHLAAIWGQYANLCMLLKYQGDPNITDTDGRNALDYASQSTELQASLCIEHLKRIILGDGYLTELSSFEKSNQGGCSYEDDSFEIENILCPNITTCLARDQEYTEATYTKLKSKQSAFQDKECYHWKDEKHNKTNNIHHKHDTFRLFNASPLQNDIQPTQKTANELEDDSFCRDFMTDNESSSFSLVSGDLESFYTAYEGDLTFDGTLDDTVVTFPKLHPWTKSNDNDGCLDDVMTDNMGRLNMDASNDSLDLEASCIVNGSILTNDTVLYNWKEYSILETSIANTSLVIPDSLMTMSCQQLKKELEDFGVDPGPVREDTKMLYVKRLVRLKNGIDDNKPSDMLKEFLPEVRAVIEGRLPSPEMDPVEESMCVEFTKKDLRDKWREGTEKSSFNYLLLDPRVTQNLPLRSKKMSYEDIFYTFVAAVFYVGKGKRSRPYAHLYEAAKHEKVSRKLQQIRAIWSADLGVVSLHCFQGVIPVEAYTREACMVDALGLNRLTNKKRGDYYGRAKSWSVRKKRQMGVFLIKRALQIFLNEGERQIRPEDLKTK